MTLPDIPEDVYHDWQVQQFGQDTSGQIDSLGFEAAANHRIATLEPPPPPPIDVQESLGRIGGWATTQPAAAAPEPPPTPPPPSPQPDSPPAAVPAAPAPVESAPSPPTAPPQAPAPAPTPQPSGFQGWIGSALGAVQQAGGDVGVFAQNFKHDAGDVIGSALGAAQQAGADVGQFASRLPPLPAPPQPAPVAPSPSMPAGQGGDLQSYARQAAQRAGIDPDIFVRQIQQESGFNPNARSPAGATGIAQFMPETAKGMGVDPSDPYAALDAAARLNAQNLSKYGGDYSKALAAYNAGGGAVDKYGGVPPFEETRRYVNTILGGGPAPGRPTPASVFPVQGFTGDVQDHWGSVKGGSDLFAPRGTPVVAMQGGKVIESGWNDVGGNSVLIQGTDGNQYYYAHGDSAPNVKVGDTVTAGTYLMPVGDTGDAKGTGTHLHIGIGPDIKLGADKYGGTGGDFNAVGLLQAALTAQRTGQATTPAAAGPAAIAPPTSGNVLESTRQQLLNSLGALGSTGRDILKAMGMALNPDTSGPMTAAQQPYPSDLLTNPLGTGNAATELPQPSEPGLPIPYTGPNPSLPEGTPTGLAGVLDQIGKRLPDISDLLQAPDPKTPLGRVVQGTPITQLSPVDQAIAFNQWNQMYSQAAETGTERINPARDLPVAGGLINQATNPENILALAAGGPVGRTLEGALGTGLRGTLGRAAVEGAGFNALTALQKPEATPESVALAGAEGAVAGPVLVGAGRLAGPVLRTIGQGLPDLVPARVSGILGGLPTREAGEQDLTDRLRQLDARLGWMPSETDPYNAANLMRAYESVTPDRIASIQGRVQDFLSPLLTPRNGDQQVARNLIQQIWDAGVSQLQDSRVTATGLSDKAAAALADTGEFTNKLNSVGTALDSAKATRSQVGPSRVDINGALDFVNREAAADRMALGSTQALDDLGNRDPGALNRVYAYTSAGPPLIGPQKPVMWVTWEDGAPRVVTAHHHYGIGSPDADIHVDSTPPGLKSLMWDNAAVQGDRISTPTGDSIVNWQDRGLDVGGGRKIASTDALVGPSGENDMRMATALASMPADVQKAIRSGQLTSPEQIAAVLLRESPPQSAPGVLAAKRALGVTSEGKLEKGQLGPTTSFADEVKQRLALSAVDNGKRTESLMVDPQLRHIKAIYLAGTEKDLHDPSGLANLGGRSRLQVAQAVRRQIREKTGKDVPIIFKDITPQLTGREPSIPSKLISDARTLEGPKNVTLAPGRQRIVRGYMAAGYPNVGLLPQTRAAAEATGSAPNEAAAQTLYERLKQSPMLTAQDAAQALGSKQLPGYLDGVVQYLTEQRQKVAQGSLTSRDVAKAWLLTLSSMRSQAREAGPVGEALSDIVGLEKAGSIGTLGKRTTTEPVVRPEDATAAWMLTPQGRAALDSFAEGKPTPEALQSLEDFRKAAGFGQPMMRSAYLTSQKVKGEEIPTNWMQNIPEVTQKLNDAARSGDWQAFEDATMELRGIGPNKTAFIKQLLGLGNGVTMDSNEINWWLTGIPDARNIASDETQKFLGDVARAGSPTGIPGYLQQAVGDRFAQLRDMGYGADIPEDAYNHVMHHWLWDTIKNATTPHTAMYDAMRNALVASESPTPVRGIGAGLQGVLRRTGTGAVYGGIGGGYQASQQEGATPEDIARGVALGAVSGAGRAAIGRLPTGLMARALAEEEGPQARGLVDEFGRLLDKASPIADQLIIPGRERMPDLTEIYGPSGRPLTELVRGNIPAGGEVTAPVRTYEGALPGRAPAEASEEMQRLFPNLAYFGKDDPALQATVQRIAEENQGLARAYQQGTISHDELINDLAPKVGMTTEDFMNSKIGTAFNPAEQLVLNATAEYYTHNLQDMAQNVARKGVGGLSASEKLDFIRQAMEATQLQDVARGGSSTAARTLNQQKIAMDRQLARAIVGPREQKAAEAALAEADNRAQKIMDLTSRIKSTRQQAQDALSQTRQQATERGQKPKDVQSTLDRINRAYAELEAYQAMTLDEKGADLAQREAARAERAARRAEALGNRDAPEQLLSALQDELAAERQIFKGHQKTWNIMADNAEKQARRVEGLRMTNPDNPRLSAIQAGAEDQGALSWLEANAKVAARNRDTANSRLSKAWQDQMGNAERRNNMAAQILKRMGGRGSEDFSDDMVKKLADAMTSNDPMAAAKFIRSLQHVSWWDRLGILRYASMLSATTTHTAQAASNLGQLGLAMAAHPAAVGYDALASALTGGQRTRYMAELPAMMAGLKGGFTNGAKDAAEIMRSGINPADASRWLEANQRSGFASGNAAIDFLAEGPLRTLEAGDALVRGGARGAYTNALAVRRAIQEGYYGEQRADRVKDILQHLEDYPDLVDNAEGLAKRIVLQEQRAEMRGFGAKQGPAGFAQSLVLPFVRTPYNVAAQGLGMTPAGFAAALKAAADGDRGLAVDRAAKATLGTGIMGLGYALAANGHLTGAMPSDPTEKSTLPPGWQPWSVRIDTPGGPSYVKYSNMGPVGVPLAMAATAHDAFGRDGQTTDPSDILGRFVGGFGRYMTDQTMLQGLANLTDAITQPDRKGENFIEGLTTQFLPYAALGRQLDRALGTSPRDPHGFWDALSASYPAVSGMVRPRLNAWGEPVEQTQSGLGTFLSPFTYGMERDDPYLRLLHQSGVGIDQAPRDVSSMELTDEERRQYPALAAPYIQRGIDAATSRADWASLTDDQRREILRQVVANAHQAAGGLILRNLTPEERAARHQQTLRRLAVVPGR